MKAQLLKGVIHTYIYTSHEYIYIVHVNNIEGERWIREEGGDLKVFEGEGEGCIFRSVQSYLYPIGRGG